MSFDLMRIIFMVISILVGNVAGAFIGSFIGFGGALIGALIVGIAIYFIYSILSGQSITIFGAILFGILNYIATMITGYVGAFTGFAGGIVTILIEAVVLSLLWGWLGAKAQPNIKTGLKA